MTNHVQIVSDDRTELGWMTVNNCPSCGGAPAAKERLYNQRFHFGGAAVPRADKAVHLSTCGVCGLIFKDLVPSPQLLAALTTVTQDHLWTSSYDYASEVAAIRTLGKTNDFDILDVGAAGGELLRAVQTAGRKSALDIAQFGALTVTGEFIIGFLDTPDICWSEVAYSIVTVFDVLEHLYDPRAAMKNLARFVKPDGYVVVETGDSDAVAKDAMASWYYLNGVDHHIAWNKQSFEALAQASGFEIVSFDQKAHKMAAVAVDTWKSRLKLAVFTVVPQLYKAVYALSGRAVSIPRRTEMKDHFRAVLRTVPPQ